MASCFLLCTSVLYLMLKAGAAASTGTLQRTAAAWGRTAARVARPAISVRSIHGPGAAGHVMPHEPAYEPQQQPVECVQQADAAWRWFEAMGSPKLWVSAGQLRRRRCLLLPPAASARTHYPTPLFYHLPFK